LKPKLLIAALGTIAILTGLVVPINLPAMFKYFGGKSRYAHKIVDRIPPHKTWVEPFAGGAQ
jgi:predicted CDP-diglyceride synthetase/phosphatidate cytidylyltransferase